MKTLLFSKYLTLFCFTNLLFFNTSQGGIPHLLPDWEKLGQKKVNFKLDRDEVYVTAKEGRYSKIQLKVKAAGINLHRCVVHFRHGKAQEIKIRKHIAAGGETRIIDLIGRKRIIKKIVFWYDTKKLEVKRGTVELWGRR